MHYNKFKKTVAALTVTVFTVSIVSAQAVADTVVNGGPGSSAGLFQWFAANWKEFVSAIFGVYEIAVRLFPTVRSYSVLTFIIGLLHKIVPDNNASDPTAPFKP